MSPGQQRKHRYAPLEDVPPPEPRTRAEAAALARTWPEWEEAQPGIGKFGGRVLGVPWALDWQSNPRAPLPPGFIWVRCLCFATVCRPPDWSAQVRTRNGGMQRVRPSFTVGSRCDRCQAPYLRIEHRDDPYEITLELGEQPGWREYLRRNGLLRLEEGPADTPAE
jgi:hypothetical protein